MRDENPEALIDALDDLLEAERSALLAGEVDEINRMADRKEALIVQLNSATDLPQQMLLPLHEKITRNQGLITSALDGIRAVADRMAEMRSVRRTLQTYDRSGTIREIRSDAARKIEKRA